MSLESSFELVKQLVSDFKNNESHYLSTNYSEVDVRRDFIDKFFTALGWDVNHNDQKNPYEQEVKVEKDVKIERAHKRADYAFFIAPNYKDAKFFVEAKKPSRNLSNQDDYFQTCRYGWNSGTPISVLTDFEEFHILDCRYKPDHKSILNNKIKFFHYSDYTDKEKFAELFYLFSRESVGNNSIEKYVDALPKPKGKSVQKGMFTVGNKSIDESFLEDLDEIRNKLAKTFKKNNQQLTSEELTEATQRTIDRLVFIRFLEDKQIEPEHYISKFGKSHTAWQDFISSSKRLNAKYNGIVFREHLIDNEKEIQPEENVFTGICDEFSHTNSPYNFDLIPIHILGSIYERFLGSIVNATEKRVKIEAKPEVRKAGGVYYTPQYIVNYIVDNTIGKLIDGKTPKEISQLRFADISCGSGSFLITMFDKLLDYHRKWYQENPEQAKKDGCRFIDGVWNLTVKQKQEILLNNIYGVDIDNQAVEVSQLSLYLKLLEDETLSTAQDTWVLFKERILPNLNKNIICGNSLIGTDYNNTFQFNNEEEKKLKPMNFEDVFPEIMKKGGFDAIVGNPPYVGNLLLERNIVNYLLKKFNDLKGQIDLYSAFILQSIGLLKTSGLLSYIVPRFVKFNLDSEKIRQKMLSFSIEQLIEVGKAFKNANTECIVFLLSKDKNNEHIKIFEYYPYEQLKYIKQLSKTLFSSFPNYIFNTKINPNEIKVINKIKAKTIPLSKLASIKRGMEIGKRTIRENKNGIPTLLGEDVLEYYYIWNNTYCNSSNLELKRLKSFSETDKLLVRRVATNLICAYDEKNFYFIKNLYSIISQKINLKYLLAIINSKLLRFFFTKYFTTKKVDLFPEIQSYQIASLPIIAQSNENIQLHDRLILLVDQMLETKKQLALARTDSDRDYLQRKCDSTDHQIDSLVYQLYDLTEEEIKIVEEG